jgi:hypothetical protein
MESCSGAHCAIHMSLQGKGGVGKSLAASVLAQYFTAHEIAVRCIDADPVNKTLYQYRTLAAKPLQLLRDGMIDQRAFDELIEELATNDGPFVVDNGASTFVPLWHYMLESDVPGLLRRAGRKLYLHTVITGGQALADTVNGFAEVAATTPERSVIVWINEFFGRVEYEGKQFTEMKAYTDHQDKVCGSVGIPRRNHETFGRDVEEVISRKLTFEEAIRDGKFSLMTKQRLKVVQRELFEQLDSLCLV